MHATAHSLFARVDASGRIGVGHFMRCLALAQHWRDLGRHVTFIGQYPESLLPLLAAEKIDCMQIDRIHPAAGDLDDCTRLIPENAVVVLDGYHFDGRYQSALSERSRLLVIDDTGHLPAYSGYALLNQNLHASQISYPEAPQRRLIGPDYALLRRQFRLGRHSQQAHADSTTRVLISLGGADWDNYTLEVLTALGAAEPADVEAHVIVGPINRHRAALESFSQAHDWVTLIDNPPDMAAAMAWAQLAIASAGSISWELAVLGLPSILIALADNQVPVGREMGRAGAAVFAGESGSIDTGTLADIIRNTLLDRTSRADMSSKAAQLVDGNGVIRVTDVLNGSSQ